MRIDPEEVVLLRGITNRGISQREVAARLGVTEALVSMWANGKRKPGSARMAALRELAEDAMSPSDREHLERVARMVAIFEKFGPIMQQAEAQARRTRQR